MVILTCAMVPLYMGGLVFMGFLDLREKVFFLNAMSGVVLTLQAKF